MEDEKKQEIEKVENKPKEKKKISILLKPFMKYIKIAGLVLVLIVILVLGIKFSKSMRHRETILDFGFKDVGELVTQEWYGRILEDSTKDRKIFNASIPFTTSRIIFSLDVEVLAGINFEEIEYKEALDQNKITITLPKSQIYKYYQVPNTFVSYLDDESWFTNINSTERHNLEDAVVEEGKEKALAAGILDKADENAKKIIEKMVKAKNKDMEIEWKEKEGK